MELLRDFVDLFLHIDKHLNELIEQYGVWTYLLLFLVIFCETGLIVLPLLPGDSLLFAAGTFAAAGSLDVHLLAVLLTVAAVLGDAVNYACGRFAGPRMFREHSRWLKREYLAKTQAFYVRHGGKTIILARFLPIIRTFAPFVAGMGQMSYGRFFAYNVVGGIVWITTFTYAGYWFGNIPIVRDNFIFVALGIVIVSVLPMAIEIARARIRRGKGIGH